jgi:argininosuccinate lyase
MKKQRTKSTHQKRLSRPESFPARVYAETVLAVNFEDAGRYFLGALLEIHAAHTLMLARQKILSPKDAHACLRALEGLDYEVISRAAYDGTFEDLFYYIEDQLSQACGEDTAGRMHTARSRNDIDLAMYRMVLRRAILGIAEATHRARQVLLNLAAEHIETLMPAYTHTQPAQPTTLAHYLLGMVEILGRDEERLRAAFATVNRNPLGACAITTTGFPIDREYTARLLGFEGLQVNSYGAIAGVDYITQAASAVAVGMVNLGRLVQDLLLWCMVEFRFLRLAEGYVQASSIMPQKRNPVSLEHTRILASKAFGQSQAVLTCLHNTPFGDIVDSEDDLQPLVFAAFSCAERALRLFAGLMEHVEVDRERLQRRAAGDFLTVTELADTLVRNEGVSFRRAHHLVSATVKAAKTDDSPMRLAKEVEALAPRILGHPLATRHNAILRALDPENFVRVRGIAGGPAPRAVASQVENARQDLAGGAAWLKQKLALLEAYPRKLRNESRKIKGKRS